MILIISITAKEDGVFKYRIENLKKLLIANAVKEEIILESLCTPSKNFKKNVKNATTIIHSKPFFSWNKIFWNALQKKQNKFKLFFDMDDLMTPMSLPKEGVVVSNNSFNYKSFIKLYSENNLIKSAADYIIVSTDRLKHFYEDTFGYKVLVVPNLIESSFLEKNQKQNKINKLKLLYMSGYFYHDYDFSKCTMDLFRFMDKFKDVELVMLGDIGESSVDMFKGFSERFNYYKKVSYKEMINIVEGCSVLINPLEDTDLNAAKSNIKYLEAAAVKKPVIVTAVDEFSKVIKDKENGLLVKKDNSNWYEVLEYAYTHINELEKMGENAYKNVKDNWIINSYKAKDLKTLINEL